MAKKTQSDVDKKEQADRKAFIEAVEKVQDEHGYRVVAMLNFSQSGVVPVLGLDKVTEDDEKVVE